MRLAELIELNIRITSSFELLSLEYIYFDGCTLWRKEGELSEEGKVLITVNRDQDRNGAPEIFVHSSPFHFTLTLPAEPKLLTLTNEYPSYLRSACSSLGQ